MTKSLFLGTAAAITLLAGAASAQTLAQVQSDDVLKCGVNSGLAGFSAPDADGRWEGFDVAQCRAIAAAVLGDQDKIEFVPTTGETRFTALANNQVDLLARNTTWTFTRDVDLKFTFTGINYYDGQGFMVPAGSVESALDLSGATICIQTGTTTELNLADYFKRHGMEYQAVPVQTNAEADQQFQAGACDAYTTDASGLAASRATYVDPSAWVILPEIISKEPLGPLVRHGDDQWADIVRWVGVALVEAEELGITSENVEEMAASENPSARRLLGTEGNLGEQLGLDADWAKRAIMATGNYGEIFARTIGEGTVSNIPRGLNALWTEGGLQYSPPFR